MKQEILNIAKVKSEKEFYKLYPTEEAFKRAFPKEFKKAKMGAAMVKKQLTQLTDFSNPPQAQDGWVQRAANANLSFWEKCRLASSADNGGGGGSSSGGGYNSSKYKNPYEEVSDIGAYDKDERKGFKSTLPAGVELSDWVAMNRDASRMNSLLRNPDYDKFTDSTGTLKPEYQSVATQFDPYYLYYKPAFAGKKSITPEEVLKFHQSQPDGLSNYKDLVNRRYMPKQENGSIIRKAQVGEKLPFVDPVTGLVQAPGGVVTQEQTAFLESGIPAPTGQIQSSSRGKLDPTGIMESAQNIIGGAQQWKEDSRMLKKYKMWGKIADLSGEAMSTRDVAKNKYVRDVIVDPNQVSPSYGTGYEPLQATAEYGAQIGGNPTEIQNMYNPGDIYSDMGYEPLDESNRVKQFANGGGMFTNFSATNAGYLGGGLGSLLSGGSNQMTGPSRTLTGVGQLAGTALGGPLGGIVGGALGGLVGGVVGSGQEKRMEEQQQKISNLGFQQGVIGMQNQNSAFMEDGGWVSHDWQPQVITQFGGHNLKDLLKDDPTMDTLRTGGSLQHPKKLTQRALQTYDMGGDLTIDGRGDIDFMGYNPVTAASGANGYIGISRGPSHDNGGFNIDYAGNKVEIEGGETIIEKKDGGSVNGDKSVVVLGDMKIGNQGEAVTADVNKETLKRILKGKDLKDVKFKHIGNEIAKRTNALNKAESKYIDLANSVDAGSKFGLLGLKTAEVGKLGIEMQYKDLDNLQSGLIDLQTAYHDSAEEYGYDDTPKFLEDIKKGKVKQKQAAMGGKFSMAQDGKLIPWQGNKYGLGKKTASAYSGQEWENIAKEMGFKGKGNLEFQKFLSNNPDALPYIIQKHKELYGSDIKFDSKLGAAWQGGIDKYFNRVPMQPNPIQQIGDIPEKAPDKVTEISTSPKREKFKFADAYSMLYPYIKPLIRNPLDPMQLAGDMYALASNQLEPVKAQQFTPQLETPYSVSFQDQLNANQADFNAMARKLGSDPAVLSQLAAQKYAANTSVLGQQSRANQQLQMEAYNRNRSLINDASLKNLAILDQQYQRQSQARSNTKAQTYEALSSIGDKYARNRTETLAANVQANMYPDYAFGPKGRIMKTGLTQFNIPTIGDYTSADLQKLAEAKKIEETKGGKTTARNGSLVKAIKNL